MSGLFGSNVLEVAIGLIFIYFLLSLTCSGINEFLAGLFKWRARDLEHGITNLICNPALAQQVLNHPLIKAMGNDNAEAAPVKALAGTQGASGKPDAKAYAGKPSYIPARTFSLALLDTLAPASYGPTTVERLREQAQAMTRATSTGQEGLPSLGKSLLALLDDSRHQTSVPVRMDDIRRFVQAELAGTSEVGNALSAITSAKTLADIRDNVVPLLPTDKRQALLDFMTAGQADFNALRTSIETWFDNSMNHVSDVYKRRVQIYLFGIGLCVTLFIGADSLQIVHTLATDGPLRDAVVAQAGHANNTADAGALVSQLDQFRQLFGYGDLVTQWGKLNAGQEIVLFVEKLIGLLLTALAVSFGAPFWFDLLNKVSNLRSGTKPNPSDPAQTAN
ncbi:MAG: hypothetical protein ACR2M0_04575 [Chloroflexia bacterium]